MYPSGDSLVVSAVSDFYISLTVAQSINREILIFSVKSSGSNMLSEAVAFVPKILKFGLDLDNLISAFR